jgi:hypothetical protein
VSTTFHTVSAAPRGELNRCEPAFGVPTGGFVNVADPMHASVLHVFDGQHRAYIFRMHVNDSPFADYTFGAYFIAAKDALAARGALLYPRRPRLDPMFLTPCVFAAARSTFEPDETAIITNLKRKTNASVPVAAAIRALLPTLSEARLGALFGVSRQAWRDWIAGKALPRSAKRKRLFRLHRILELRRSVAPDEDLEAWLEQAIDPRRDQTIEDALRSGKDDVVAVLAARKPNRTSVSRYRLGPAKPSDSPTAM